MSIQADKGEAREGQRIAKVMARAGLCSRRDAELWIAAGRVSVNGVALTSPAFNVSDADDVRVDGEPLRAAERTRLFLFHKPRGLVTTAKDPEGRPTIFDALPADLPRVVTIGRLDINTEGLLLLTNDGGLARILELPATGWLRRYRVRAHGEITQEQLDGLSDGVTIDGVDYLGIEARFERQQGSNVWLTMGLREGKNREIKRVLEHMGLSVNRLIRVSFGPFELGDLDDGELVEIRTRVLRDQLGPKLAKRAGVNFDAPLELPEAPAPEPPRGDRPLRRPHTDAPQRDAPPRKRKHVSVLRAEARELSAGPRKRVARATTADRKGREVKVERLSLARPPEPTEPHAPRRGRPRDGAPRPATGTFAGRRDGLRAPLRERPSRAAADDLGDRRRGGAAPSRPPRGDERKRFDEGARGERSRNDAPRPASESFGGRRDRPREDHPRLTADEVGGRRRSGAAPSRPPRAVERKRFDEGARGERSRNDAPRPASESFGGRRDSPRGPRREDRARPTADEVGGRRRSEAAPSRPPRAVERKRFDEGASGERSRNDAPRPASESFGGRRDGPRATRREDRPRPSPDEVGGRRRSGAAPSRPPRADERKRFDEGARGERPPRGRPGPPRDNKSPPRGGKPGPRRPR